jgi:hypothetical protein
LYSSSRTAGDNCVIAFACTGNARAFDDRIPAGAFDLDRRACAAYGGAAWSRDRAATAADRNL